MKTTVSTLLVWILASLGNAQEMRKAVWREDASQAPIPTVPAVGRIQGVDFKVDRALLRQSSLELGHGYGFHAEQAFLIHFRHAVEDGEFLEGKTFSVTAEESLALPRKGLPAPPRVHLVKAQPDRFVLPPSATRGYTMILKFGRRTGNKIPGGVYLCMLDAAKSFVAGRFEIHIGSRPWNKPRQSARPMSEILREHLKQMESGAGSRTSAEIRKLSEPAIEAMKATLRRMEAEGRAPRSKTRPQRTPRSRPQPRKG